MFKSAVGMASGKDGATAAYTALDMARIRLGVEANAAIVFSTSRFDQKQVINTIRENLGESVAIVGASTAGEIDNQGPSSAPSVVIMLLASDTIGFTPVMVEDVPGNEADKAAELANKIRESVDEKDIKFMTLYADGLTVNPGIILRELSELFPGVRVAGGSAGDNGDFKQTYQYCNDQVISSGVSALVFTGKLDISFRVKHGWNPISSFKTVTKAKGSVIYEIDNKPAIDFYEEFVGIEKLAKIREVPLGTVAMSYPLGVKDMADGRMLLRSPITIADDGSVTLAGDIEEGNEVQMMVGDKDSAISAAKEAAENACSGLEGDPVAALIFSCFGRKTVYESKIDSSREVKAVQEAIGDKIPLIGFYSYGEYGPIGLDNVELKTCNNVNYNETLVTLLLGEKS